MRFRFTIVLPLLLVASGAVWFGAPQGAAQQAESCTLSPRGQPALPLEMNTVVSDPRTSQFRDALFKHVVMEKEIYDCLANPGTPDERPFTRDVETFIEIIQRAQQGRTVPVEKRVEEIVCDKGNDANTIFGVQCSARDVPLIQEGLPNVRCLPPGPNGQFRQQPADPVEMNTSITSRQDTIKTMKVEKEIVTCAENDGSVNYWGHLYVFTEIVEARVGGAFDTIRPTEKKFQAILCLAPQDGSTIDRCHHLDMAGPTNG